MALLHQAELVPGKLDLLAAWLPTRAWFPYPADAELTRATAFRYDDPAGEVGIETIVVRAGAGPLVQVPLTYRAAPLVGADEWLVGTTEHSVLGRRWVYDGCADPVYVATLADVLFGRATQAEEFVAMADGRQLRREPLARVLAESTGDAAAGTALHGATALHGVTDSDPAVIATDAVELVLPRVLGRPAAADALATLTGTWADQPEPVVLACARR